MTSQQNKQSWLKKKKKMKNNTTIEYDTEKKNGLCNNIIICLHNMKDIIN